MRTATFLTLLIGLLLVGVANGAPPRLGGEMPPKSEPLPLPNVPMPRQGGDTIADAFPIDGIPFTDTGTTTGYADDYDEACPYVGSTSPDVVYAFTPVAAVDVDVDLCGSAYDTKVYVYGPGQELVDCNDDAYFDDECGQYVSKLEGIALAAGTTYHIVVDGYGGDHGDYVMAVAETVPCVVECPQTELYEMEGEPPLHDGYVDTWNGGCNSEPPAFQMVESLPDNFQSFCGRSGWYVHNGANTRDTDWLVMHMGFLGYIDIAIDAESPVYLYELFPQDCENVEVVQQVTGGPCDPGYMTITGYGEGAPVWIWIGPTAYEAPGEVTEFDYSLYIVGLSHVDAAEPTSWSHVKALYGD